jgi:hypothetical protein
MPSLALAMNASQTRYGRLPPWTLPTPTFRNSGILRIMSVPLASGLPSHTAADSCVVNPTKVALVLFSYVPVLPAAGRVPRNFLELPSTVPFLMTPLRMSMDR